MVHITNFFKVFSMNMCLKLQDLLLSLIPTNESCIRESLIMLCTAYLIGGSLDESARLFCELRDVRKLTTASFRPGGTFCEVTQRTRCTFCCMYRDWFGNSPTYSLL